MRSNFPFAGRVQGTVAVVGLGKIGLPLAVYYALHGWHVLGCDSNPQVVEFINTGRSHILEEPELVDMLPELVHTGRLSATTDTSAAVSEAKVIVVIVPVTIDDAQRVQFSAIDAATLAVAKGLKPGALVIYETTLPVGSTAGRLRRRLEEGARLEAGRDFFLAYSPERVSSGSIFRDLRSYPKIVGGIDADSTAAAVTFYRSVLEASVHTLASSDEAEFVKLIETTYRDVNIALANEYARFADAFGLNVSAAIQAANTQPFSHIHQPGLGVGGHCIPVYPHFLLASLENDASALQLPRAARRINDTMAEYAVQRLASVLGSLRHLPVLILGTAYRADVREMAFTSARLLQAALEKAGAVVYAHDPLFDHQELRAAGFTPLLPEQTALVQAIILQAYHTTYRDLNFADFSRCQVVLDGRHALERTRVEAAGMRYITPGDGGLSPRIPRAPVPVSEQARRNSEGRVPREMDGGWKSGEEK